MTQARLIRNHALAVSGPVALATPHALQLWRLVAVALCVPGLVVLFLPMVWHVSPIDAVTPNQHMFVLAWLLAVPFFVAVPMMLWRVRAFWARPVGRAETWAMLVLGLVATASFAWASGLMIASAGVASAGDLLREFGVVLTLSWALIVPGLVLLRRAWRSRRHLPVAAEQFLCSSHLSGVVWWWITALYEGKYSDVESGVWVAALACACDVALIALLQTKARGAADV
jgi:hypothetical protein